MKSLTYKLYGQVRLQVRLQVDVQVLDQVSGQVYDQVRNQVYDQVSAQVWWQGWDKIGIAPFSSLEKANKFYQKTVDSTQSMI